MNLKKLLQKQAEEDAEVFLNEEDELFIQQLIQANKLKDTDEKAEGQEEKNHIVK